MRSVALGYDTRYAYGADGNRAAKWTAGNLSETLYFNTMWTWHIEKGLSQEQQGQYSKHIYLGETRIVTKQTSDLEEHYGQSEEKCHQYYYHPDHLGSAQLVTDYDGNEYQRIEYTPYGELWVEKKTANEKDMRYLPYKFTAKEQDEETGFYYYGARYLDAKYSRWLSADPAVGEYINGNSTSGGLYNTVNFNLYHYTGNNPVKYIDPDGNDFGNVVTAFGRGILDSVVGDVKGIVNVFVHPIKTATAMYNTVKADITDLVTDPGAYVAQKIDDVKQGVTNFMESSPEEKAYTLGGITEKVAVAVITQKAVKTISNKISGAAQGAKIAPSIKGSNHGNKFTDTLQTIRKTGKSPYRGGQIFNNREGFLPKIDEKGNSITYKKWDVDPKLPGGRNSDRLITGSDNSVYKTTDHYRTFEKIE